ncbi:MAG: NUDIX domain-containing protein [Candidatus Pacebacteria bacterium]|nr:NUDIX domain-containing protein [Candidatus Paceibacterota bacterium]
MKNKKATQFVINVSTAIFKDDQVLLVKRGQDEDTFPGFWVIPGGKIELKDKTITSGLAREVLEETNIRIKNHFLVSSEVNQKKAKIYLRFRSYYLSGNPKPLDKTVEVRWFSLNKLPSKIVPQTKVFLNEFRKS